MSLNTMFLVVISMAFALITTVTPLIHSSDIIGWHEEHHFCGDSINMIMGLICEPDTRHHRFTRSEDTEGRHLVVKREILKDCCIGTCTPAYMQMYCPDDQIKTSHSVQLFKPERYGTHLEHPTDDAPTLPHCDCCPQIKTPYWNPFEN